MATPGLNLPDLRVGARGPAVLAVHRQLARDGFYSSSIDGNFGPATERAVRAFQRRHNVPDDGVVGAATWAALGAAGLDLSVLATPPDSEDDLTTSGVAEEETPATSGIDEPLGMSSSVRYTSSRCMTPTCVAASPMP